MKGYLTTATAWASYASRMQAVPLLAKSESGRGNQPLSMGDADGEIPRTLQELEQATFLQVVCGEKPLSYFDEFVQEWYSSGGDKLTQEVQKGYDEKNK